MDDCRVFSCYRPVSKQSDFFFFFFYLSFRYISYPRTETNIFPKDLNLMVLVEQQTPDPHWGAFAQSILERGGPTPRNGSKSDQAHPPIHPTKYTSNLQVGFCGCESSWNSEAGAEGIVVGFEFALWALILGIK
jgi:hypothetical protein